MLSSTAQAQYTWVLYGGGCIEAAPAHYVYLLNHDGLREGGAGRLEVQELVFIHIRCDILTWLHNGRG